VIILWSLPPSPISVVLIPQIPALCLRTSVRRRRPRRIFATSKSYLAWRFIQNLSEVPKYLARRRAVSAVIALEPCTISLIRLAATPISLARRYWLRFIGTRNSSNRISQGCIGEYFFFVISNPFPYAGRTGRVKLGVVQVHAGDLHARSYLRPNDNPRSQHRRRPP
jgi:hypothetical protein